MTLKKGSSSGEKSDLFAPEAPATRDIFDKQRSRWTKGDYIKALQSLSDRRLKFNVWFQREMLVSPAFLMLSPRAAKLLMCCWNVTWLDPAGLDKRNTNKHTIDDRSTPQNEMTYETAPFMLPYSLAEAFGVGTRKQITKAFQELKALGFIKQIGISRRNYPNVYKRSEGWRRLSFEDVQRIQAELKLNKGVI